MAVPRLLPRRLWVAMALVLVMNHGGAAGELEGVPDTSLLAEREGVDMEGVYSDFLEAAASPNLEFIEVKPPAQVAQQVPQAAPAVAAAKGAPAKPDIVQTVRANPAKAATVKTVVVAPAPAAVAAAAAAAAEKKKIKKKTRNLQHKAHRARWHAHGDRTKIEAIETHIALAQKAGARAFLHFVESFRRGARTQFWQTYKRAKKKRYQLVDIYHQIRRHVKHAWKKMYANGAKLHKAYMTQLKAYWKAKYQEPKKLPKGETKAKLKHEAKLAMKKARSALQHFKKMQHKAKRHAKHLKKGLAHAIHKLHFVFMKARRMYRHISKAFVAKLDVQLASKKTVSHQPLHKLHKKQVAKTKARHHHSHPAPKKGAHHHKDTVEKSNAVKSDAVKSAEIKAVKIVKRAILQQQREQAATLVETKRKPIALEDIPRGTHVIRTRRHTARIVRQPRRVVMRRVKSQVGMKKRRGHGEVIMEEINSSPSDETTVEEEGDDEELIQALGHPIFAKGDENR